MKTMIAFISGLLFFPSVVCAESASVEQLFSSLTLREKVGQLFMAYPAHYTDKPNVEGGFIFFRSSLKSAQATKDHIQSISKQQKVKPFLATDIEGGYINRLKHSKKIKGLQSALRMSQLEDVQIQAIGASIAAGMKEYGLNMNLAPVLDLSVKGHIAEHERAWGNKPDQVTHKAGVFAKSINHIIPVAKHFPGYGEAMGNTDDSLITVDWSTKRIKTGADVFQQARPWLECVMLSNIIYKTYGDKPTPFTPEIIQMAHDMGFVVMTDDLAVPKFKKLFQNNRKKLIQHAFSSGADIFLLSVPSRWKGVDYIEEVVQFVKQNPQFQPSLNQRVMRILTLKEKYNLL